MSKYRDSFTTDELIKAIKKAKDEGKTKKSIVATLGLEPESGLKRVASAMKALKDQGVAIPDFRRVHAPIYLTPEQVASYNERLTDASDQPEEVTT